MGSYPFACGSCWGAILSPSLGLEEGLLLCKALLVQVVLHEPDGLVLLPSCLYEALNLWSILGAIANKHLDSFWGLALCLLLGCWAVLLCCLLLLLVTCLLCCLFLCGLCWSLLVAGAALWACLLLGLVVTLILFLWFLIGLCHLYFCDLPSLRPTRSPFPW